MGHMPARNDPTMITKQTQVRSTLFLLYLGLSMALFYAPMSMLVRSSLDNELYSHIILIPLVSVYLIYTRRNEIFQVNGTSVIHGGVLILAGVALFLFGRIIGTDLEPNDFL